MCRARNPFLAEGTTEWKKPKNQKPNKHSNLQQSRPAPPCDFGANSNVRSGLQFWKPAANHEQISAAF